VNHIKIGLLGFLTFITLNSYAVSNGFNCDSPQSSLEVSICQDDDLKRLNAVYNEFLFRLNKVDTQSSDEIEREVYVNLRKCNDDKSCLATTYKESIQSLKSVISKYESQQKPVEVEKPVLSSSQVTTEKSNNFDFSMFSKYTINDYSFFLNAYLLLVGILYVLTKMYSTKNFLTKTLFFIIGFPFVLIGWTVTLINIRSDRHRYLDENQSGGDYDDDSDDEPARKGSSDRKSSSGSSSSSSQKKEKIIIEYQGTGGGWFTIGSAPSDNSYQIAQSLKTYANGIARNPNFSGKIRARGADSGRVYDMNITK